MAANAIFKVKEAEDKSAELVRQANDKAKNIISNAEAEGVSIYNKIIQQANSEKMLMINSATKKANDECEPLLKSNETDIAGILHPDGAKFNAAVTAVIERIVNINGNS